MLKRKTDDTVILKLHGEGKSQRQIAKELGCSKTAVLKRLRKLLSHSGHQAGNHKEDVVSQVVHACVNQMPKYSRDQRYLRKTGTNEVFAYSPYLVQRGDIVPYTWPIPIPEDFQIPENEANLLKLIKNAAVNQYGNRGQ